MRKVHEGFTLIELMIVVAIIGILAGVALPEYRAYTKRARFTEVVQAAAAFKTAIVVAAQEGRLSALDDADAGTNGIPANIGTGTGVVASVSVSDGIITATGTSAVDGKTFVLVPTGITIPIQWSTSGTCLAAALC